MVLILTRNKAIYVFYICVSGKFFRKYKHFFLNVQQQNKAYFGFNEKIFDQPVVE